ncbi:chaplin [Streptomyces sp. V4-01]|uniref:Chaplin n=1 Tax=Actinacidiphila polyblastidii TaxID=3110430 RepID=A0ABU7PAD5_9ACTN|nr:chaplin [Streptomyces sp. V4-01]
MNRVARKGLVTAMVAGGVLASAGYAQADSAAGGETAGSPGVLSGNAVQVPVDIPVNVCGNTVDVIGLLNPAMGNSCADVSHADACADGSSSQTSGVSAERRARPVARSGRHAGAPADERVVSGGPRRPADGAVPGGARTAGGALAAGGPHGSPGLLSGNSLHVPVSLPVNLSGNSVNVVGVGNPSIGNTSVNHGTPPVTAVRSPAPAAPAVAPRAAGPALAHTGADGIGAAAAAGAGLLLGGAVLYRRSRPGRAA